MRPGSDLSNLYNPPTIKPWVRGFNLLHLDQKATGVFSFSRPTSGTGSGSNYLLLKLLNPAISRCIRETSEWSCSISYTSPLTPSLGISRSKSRSSAWIRIFLNQYLYSEITLRSRLIIKAQDVPFPIMIRLGYCLHLSSLNPEILSLAR